MTNKMYFIANGKIDIYHLGTNTSFCTIMTGGYFGEIAFFTGLPRTASARCEDFVDLLSLGREGLLSLIENSLRRIMWSVYLPRVRLMGITVRWEFSAMSAKAVTIPC
jgi:CRP-like cAMP-binding protein